MFYDYVLCFRVYEIYTYIVSALLLLTNNTLTHQQWVSIISDNVSQLYVACYLFNLNQDMIVVGVIVHHIVQMTHELN